DRFSTGAGAAAGVAPGSGARVCAINSAAVIAGQSASCARSTPPAFADVATSADATTRDQRPVVGCARRADGVFDLSMFLSDVVRRQRIQRPAYRSGHENIECGGSGYSDGARWLSTVIPLALNDIAAAG